MSSQCLTKVVWYIRSAKQQTCLWLFSMLGDHGYNFLWVILVQDYEINQVKLQHLYFITDGDYFQSWSNIVCLYLNQQPPNTLNILKG